MTSLRDTLLVARFEVLRAIRSWQALAVIVLYVVSSAGATRIFVNLLQFLEGGLADTLGVPRTDYPGALLAELVHQERFVEVIAGMVGDPTLVDGVLAWPVLAIFHLWLGFALVPYLAATTSAESISVDLRTRALRFELMRTGRLELVLGRFAGQAALTAVAIGLSVLGTWTIAMGFMVAQPPLLLLAALAWVSIRTWALSLPYIGIGIAASQWTSSPAWARVLAVIGTSLTWALYGLATWGEGGELWPLWDALALVLPQGWMLGLWLPTPHWLVPCAYFAALGVATTGLGYVRFAWRDV